MFNMVDCISVVPGDHLIGWETRAALVPLPVIVIVDGQEGVDILRS